MGHGYLSRWALWLVVAVAFGGTRSTTMQAHVMPGGGARVDRVRTLAVQGSDRLAGHVPARCRGQLSKPRPWPYLKA